MLFLEANPDSLDAFNSLYFYMVEQQDKSGELKRKKPNTTTISENNKIDELVDSAEAYTTIFELPNLSFQSPLRKKLTIRFAINENSNNKKPVLLIVNPNLNNKIEFKITDLSSQNIYFASFLPVIEKSKLQYLVIFYKSNSSNAFNNDPLIISYNQEQLVVEFEKFKYISENEDKEKITQSCKDRIMNQAKICGFHIIDPFVYKNGVNSFYVQAHKGTKEGTLYFLPQHVLFGFKKPVLLFHSSEIKTITYSLITRVTFNVTFHIETENISESVEFSMIDQQDYSKIDSYIQLKDVLNNSMAEELKAKSSKKLNDEFEDGQYEDNAEDTTIHENAAIQVGHGNIVEEDEDEDDDDDKEDADFELNGVEDIDDTSDVSSMEEEDY